MSVSSVPAARIQASRINLARFLATTFRFSLRELFLGMSVCAALAAWVHERRERIQPLHPSHIAEYFATGLQNDIRAARSETGETGEAWSFALPSYMEMTGVYKREHCLNREWFCDLRLPWEKARPFHDDLVRRVNSHIRRGQVGEYVDIVAEEYESGSTIDLPVDMYGDSTKYHCGDIHGTIRLYLVRTDDQHARLIAISNEHRVP